jgi:hypothetical protein
MTTEGEGAPSGNGEDGESNGRQKKQTTEKPHWVAYVEACCAVLLVVITGTYTYYAAGQLHKMRRATKAAEDSAYAAQNAADTASKTLIFTQDSFRDEQRAWIGVPEIKIVNLPKPAKMNVIFHNSGRTPALHLKRAFGYMISPTLVGGPKPKYIADLEKELTTKGYVAVAPDGGGILEAIDRDGYVFKQWQNIVAGTEFLYSYGIFRYNDVAGRPHATTYCYYLSDPNGIQQFRACEQYNDMN